ncbi:hypothetical protein M432DRAFT_265790 [Thermoascus aurantiacus ATCC 26904]
MSYYDDRRYHRPSRDRDRYARPSYIDEPYVGYKGRDRDMDFVRRRYDDSDDSLVEEAHRDFAPGEYGPGYYRYGHGRPRHSRTVLEGRPHSTGGRDPYYGDGYYYYRPDSRCRSKRYDDRRDRPSKYSGRSPSRSPSPLPRRRKSLSEQALSALGGALGSSASKQNGSGDTSKRRDRDRSRSREDHHHLRPSSSSPSRRRNREHHDKSEDRIAQAVKAALAAGAAEAWRVRKEPGGWTGEKGKRILTAAITAGSADGLLDRNPDKHGKRHIIESVLAGLATDRVVNGPWSRSRSRARSHTRSHGRSRSESRGAGLKDLAATSVPAAAGDENKDRVRSKSRGRQRSSSRDSYDSRSPPPYRGSKKRSQSVSEYITKGLGAMGLSDEADNANRGRRGRSSRYSDDSYDDSDDDGHRFRRHGRP